MRVTITIQEMRGDLAVTQEGIPETDQIGDLSDEYVASLTKPQRFGLTLMNMLKDDNIRQTIIDQFDPGKGGSTRCKSGPGQHYPCRCKIIDPEGEKVWENDTHEAIALQNPTTAVPKLGRKGTAYLEPDGVNVRIKLDDGSELMGYECWWEPIADTN